MIGSDVGERTLMTRKHVGELQSTHGPENDLAAKIGDFYLGRAEKNGYSGAAMYDPLAVGTVIDPTLVKLQDMHIDVETRGQFTRGETVGNRMGANEKYALSGDHYEIIGYDVLSKNARVVVSSDSDRFLDMFIARVKGK
jgi:inosine-uridine nucleoside N-ribohydrolase